MNSGTRNTSSRFASVTRIRPMSGGVRLEPWSDVTTSSVSSQFGSCCEVVEQLADQRVDGADLHAVQLELHARLELVRADRPGRGSVPARTTWRYPLGDNTHGRCGTATWTKCSAGSAVIAAMCSLSTAACPSGLRSSAPRPSQRE